jgi:hypothetical protein
VFHRAAQAFLKKRHVGKASTQTDATEKKRRAEARPLQNLHPVATARQPT